MKPFIGEGMVLTTVPLESIDSAIAAHEFELLANTAWGTGNWISSPAEGLSKPLLAPKSIIADPPLKVNQFDRFDVINKDTLRGANLQ